MGMRNDLVTALKDIDWSGFSIWINHPNVRDASAFSYMANTHTYTHSVLTHITATRRFINPNQWRPLGNDFSHDFNPTGLFPGYRDATAGVLDPVSSIGRRLGHGRIVVVEVDRHLVKRKRFGARHPTSAE